MRNNRKIRFNTAGKSGLWHKIDINKIGDIFLVFDVFGVSDQVNSVKNNSGSKTKSSSIKLFLTFFLPFFLDRKKKTQNVSSK